MSEVLVSEEQKIILLSSLASDQVVRTAHIVDAMGILLVNSKRLQENAKRLAEEYGLNVISTGLTMFEACAALADISGSK
ncbi:MAG: hypothetical protein LBQ61_04720 [Spirochaetales bacterium]|jgi:hypothetical protein|nr:hypothetical protein [Spirochaetales bacterium]